MRARGAFTSKRIVLPEAHSPVMLRAAREFVSSYGGRVLLVADEHQIREAAADAAWELDGAGDAVQIAPGVEPDASSDLRVTHAMALVASGQADGVVAGLTTPSATVIRAARRRLFDKAGSGWISESVYLHVRGRGVVAFADIAVTPTPTPGQLVSVARDTAHQFGRLTGLRTSVAFLSFSTLGSAATPEVDQVRSAVEQLRVEAPDLDVDGELQFDAAFSPVVAAIKAPASPVAGRANVFIFPDLNSANIGYKVAQFLGGAEVLAIVPAGLLRPVVDVSRGSDADTVITSMCLCAALA